MKKTYALVLIAVSVGSTAMAQAGPTQSQTTDQLVCQLSNDCAPIDLNTDKLKEKGASRGFSIYRPTASTAKTLPASTPSVRSNSRVSVVEARSRPALSVGRTSVHRRTPVGRAELMVNFVSGSAALADASRDNAMALLGAVNAPQLVGKRFAIEGHTDSVGSRAANLDLSQRRAQAVVDFLTKNGVDATRFEVHGYGPDKPITGLGAGDGRNRRVEVVVIK